MQPGNPQNYLRNGLLNILIANSVPLIGVFVFDWHVAEVVITFWLQSVFIGIFNLLKMGMAKGKPAQNNASRLGLMFFFLIHYFGFILAQGFFILFFVLAKGDLLHVFKMDYPMVFTGITLSLGYTFINEYILSGQYLVRSYDDYFFSPYGRVFVQQILVLGTGASAAKYNMEHSTFVIILLVGLKLIADIGQFLVGRIIQKNNLKTQENANT